MGEHKHPKVYKQIGLDWAFDKRLEGEQEQLRVVLKPNVVTWVNNKMPVVRKQLTKALRYGMEATMTTRTVHIGSLTNPAGTTVEVWMFNALTHNRDIGTDVIAMVAASKDAVDIMRDSFMQAVEQRMGKGQPPV